MVAVVTIKQWFTVATQQQILFFSRKGKKSTTIVLLLREEGIYVTAPGVRNLLKKYEETGTISRRLGSGRPSKITPEVLRIVEEQMEKDDETTATQLQKILLDHQLYLSLTTILRSRSQLGWTFRGSSYCQLIKTVNKVKRLDWAKKYEHLTSIEDSFGDVVWTDESTIQMESHRRYCCRKRGRQPKPKPRYGVQ